MLLKVGEDDSGIIIREFQPQDIEQCKYLLEHTQSLYGNPSIYVKVTFETDMKDIVRNYMELTDRDEVLPTSLGEPQPRGDEPTEIPRRRRGTWLVAVDTRKKTPEGHDTVCGQVAIHPLRIGDPNVFKYYTEKLGALASVAESERPFPYNFNIDANDVCELRRMAVLPDYQSKKVGYSLLKAFTTFAKEILSYRIIHLTTLVSMRQAVSFYTRQEFRCERLEFLRMASSANSQESEGQLKYVPGVVERRELPGGLESLSEAQMAEAILSPAVSSTLYVIHFWKTL